MKPRVVALYTLGVFALAGWIALLLFNRVYSIDPFSAHFRFEAPLFSLLFILPIALFFIETVGKRRQLPRLRMSRVSSLPEPSPSPRTRLRPLAPACLIVAFIGMVFGLMRPQSIHARESVELHGIDIALVLDMSLSMEATDIRPNRFIAMQEVVDDFITRRPNDRIAAVVFGREAFTLLPLTSDHAALRLALSELRLQMIDGRGTAIGNAIGTGLNRLKRSKAKSRVLILLTDGDSNAGNISPEQAAAIAQGLGIQIYSVLMGDVDDPRNAHPSRRLLGGASFPVNPELLDRISASTGGQLFIASDRRGLEESFHAILNELERSKIDDPGKVFADLYPAFLFPSLFFFLVATLLEALVFRRFP
ncbi:MAG: VWA domain-containing protein [Sandaracinaceae bacterium]|nr:VWA domain-containing protein [Sandaracinaceae bacterium]